MVESVSQKDAEKLAVFGFYSLFGTVVILLVLTLVGGVSYLDLFKDIGRLIGGNLSGVINGSKESLPSVVLNTTAVVLVTLVVSNSVSGVLNRKVKSYNMESLNEMLDKGPIVVFLVVLAEEVVTRWFFLGLLTKVFKGETAFYSLFFLGNAIWALIHLSCFTDRKEWSVLRVIPMFIGGVALTYIFVRYGLGTAIMAHFFYNAILFTRLKERLPDNKTLFTFLYFVVFSIVLMLVNSANGIKLRDISPWLSNELTPINSFGFWRYTGLLLMVGCLVETVGNLLLLDRGEVKQEMMNNMKNVFVFLLICLLSVGMVLFGNWVLSFFVFNVVQRAIILTITIALLNKTTSGSALARSTLFNLPVTYFTVVAFSILGFWTAFGLSAIFIVVDFVPSYLGSK